MPGALAASAPSSSAAGTIYVETFGTDSVRCGTQHLPCRTINYGLYRARGIQPDPLVGPSEADLVDLYSNLVTVQVGPGVYNEKVLVTFGYVRLAGAGPGSTIISAAVAPGGLPPRAIVVAGATSVVVEGFTLSDGQRALSAVDDARVEVYNCAFENNDYGVHARNSILWVNSSTFTNNFVAATAWGTSAYLSLTDTTITGRGTDTGAGVSVGESSWAQIVQTTITNAQAGVTAYGGLSLYLLDSQITGNGLGVELGEGPAVYSLFSTISDNNEVGISAVNRSYVQTLGGEITHNGVGVALRTFSAASFASDTIFSDNDQDASADATSAYVVEPAPEP